MTQSSNESTTKAEINSVSDRRVQDSPMEADYNLTDFALALAEVEFTSLLPQVFRKTDLLPLPYDRITLTQLSRSGGEALYDSILYDSNRTKAFEAVSVKRFDDFKVKESIFERVAKSGQTQVISSQIGCETSLAKVEPILSDGKVKSLIASPIFVGGKYFACLIFGSYIEEVYTFEHLELAEQASKLIYASIQRLEPLGAEFGVVEARIVSDKEDDFRQSVLLNLGFMQSLIDNVESVIFVKGVDGRYLLVNKRFELLFGQLADQIIGKTDPEVFPEDFAEAFQKIDREVARTGEVIRCEEIAPHEDGPHVYISVKFPVYDGAGKIIAVGGIATDITPLKTVERELREANIFLDSIIEHIPSMIFVKEAKELRFVRLNKFGEELLGYSRADLLGKNDYDFFPAKQADSFTSKDREVLETVKFIDIPEEPIDTKAKGPIFLHTKKISIPDDEGNPAFLLGISEDVTEQKKAREVLQDAHKQLEEKVAARTEELERLNHELRTYADERDRVNQFIRQSLKEKELLLKEIHHRVKNNMQVISSLLKLQGRYIKDEEARMLCMQSEQRVRSMALIHERLYRNDGLAEIELNSYITELSQSLFRSYAIDANKIQLKTDLEEVRLGIDQAIPCGLLLNEFISNALKHAFPPGSEGELCIGLKKQGDLVSLSFSDNGCGLPQGFEISSQESLGFEIIRTLTTQLDGKLIIHPKSPTKFTLEFNSFV